MSAETRPYRKKVRAELEEETRRRITESAVELHGTIGPARTSISAVAERAGVRRSTVYRHFPDEEALFEACSSHWSQQNPPPDPTPWLAIDDPAERLRVALGEMYAFYSRTERMLANLVRDEHTVPAMGARFRLFRDYLGSLREPLAAGRGLRGRAKARALAAVGHALAFPTWQSLTRDQGLSDAEAVELMVALVAGAR